MCFRDDELPGDGEPSKGQPRDGGPVDELPSDGDPGDGLPSDGEPGDPGRGEDGFPVRPGQLPPSLAGPDDPLRPGAPAGVLLHPPPLSTRQKSQEKTLERGNSFIPSCERPAGNFPLLGLAVRVVRQEINVKSRKCVAPQLLG